MKRVFILSGAGLSAESGLKTFRDHDGLWENYDVMQVCSTQGWQADRQLVTDFYNMRRQELANVQPNEAHKTLARLESDFPGQLYHLTQNVDDLLERAGCREVIHLHGTLRDLRCETCGKIWDIGYAAQNTQSACPECQSGSIRHNVVMFGESAPNYRHLYEALECTQLFVAIGTSGQVIDAADLARNYDHSILVNPNREERVGMFGSFEKMIDEYFSHFIQKGAVDASTELEERIRAFLLE